MGAKQDQPEIRIAVEGEGILARERVYATGAAIEPAIHKFFRDRRARMAAASGDLFLFEVLDILKLAREVAPAACDRRREPGSMGEIAVEILAQHEMAEAARDRGEITRAMAHAARVAGLGERLVIAWNFNADAIEGGKIRPRREEGQRRKAAADKAAAARKYAPLQAEADLMMRDRPDLSNLRIAEISGGKCGFNEKPDTLARRINWPPDRRRTRKTPDGQLRRP